jgi:hypothetical protein
VTRDAFPPVWLRERGAMCWQRSAATAQRVWRTAAPAGRRGLQVVKETGKTTVAHLRAIPWQILAYQHWKFVLGIVAVILLAMIIKVPQWQAASWRGQPGVELKDLPKLENDARTTLIQGLGGAVLLIGLYLTLRNLQVTQDKQITEHYTRAVEQLGSAKLEVRLGAIYALERIARDSERDHWPIMEILTAYVRERASVREEPSKKADMPSNETPPPMTPESAPKPRADIQAILTVLGRRSRTYGKGEGENQRLDLSHTDLRGADLREAHLEEATLMGVHLEEAILWALSN